MIILNRGEIKKVFFYLTPTLQNPSYIFRFKSNDTGNEVVVLSENNSTATNFQSFTFSEGSGGVLNGGFNLISGTYDYEVWESIFATPSIASASNCLEIGLMTIGGGTGSCYVWKEEDEVDFVYYEPCPPTPPGLTGV